MRYSSSINENLKILLFNLKLKSKARKKGADTYLEFKQHTPAYTQILYYKSQNDYGTFKTNLVICFYPKKQHKKNKNSAFKN